MCDYEFFWKKKTDGQVTKDLRLLQESDVS